MLEQERFVRSEALFGASAMERLAQSSVIVFGVGGVGGHAAEALVRGGIGRLGLVDADRVSLSNLNRQLVALDSTVGQLKTQVMARRARDINPSCRLETYDVFYGEDTADAVDLTSYDYIVDAIDSIESKVFLIARAHALGVPVISAMGAGNKLDPTRFRVTDIYSTSVCPLARVMRSRLRKAGVDKLDVVFSDEEPVLHSRTPASASFVPGVCGLVAAGVVLRSLTQSL